MFLILIPKSSLFLIFSCVVFPSHFGWQLLHSCFSPFISTRQVELICLCAFKSIVLVFVEILHFDFYLVHSECYLYLSVDYSLIYSYLKNFSEFCHQLFPACKSCFSILDSFWEIEFTSPNVFLLCLHVKNCFPALLYVRDRTLTK